jgi:hypothetical protein
MRCTCEEAPVDVRIRERLSVKGAVHRSFEVMAYAWSWHGDARIFTALQTLPYLFIRMTDEAGSDMINKGLHD